MLGDALDVLLMDLSDELRKEIEEYAVEQNIVCFPGTAIPFHIPTKVEFDEGDYVGKLGKWLIDHGADYGQKVYVMND